MRQNVWVRALDYLIESGWLLALVAIPIFFDTMTVRIFEPDKIALFRNVVLVMVVAFLLRTILAAPAALARASIPPTDGAAPVAAAPGWRRFVSRWPMAIPVVVFAVVYTIATIHSVLPGISFWGSYDRSQGLYTWLSYMAFFAIMAYSIRSWAQIERIVSALVFTSVPVAVYGIMQHLRWDPVQWGANTNIRVASTLGNAIFLGAYLLMCMPFAAYRLWQAIKQLRAPEPGVEAMASNGRNGRRNRPKPKDTIEITGIPPIVSVIGYVCVLVINFAAMYFNGSRGPYYGLLIRPADHHRRPRHPADAQVRQLQSRHLLHHPGPGAVRGSVRDQRPARRHRPRHLPGVHRRHHLPLPLAARRPGRQTGHPVRGPRRGHRRIPTGR